MRTSKRLDRIWAYNITNMLRDWDKYVIKISHIFVRRGKVFAVVDMRITLTPMLNVEYKNSNKAFATKSYPKKLTLLNRISIDEDVRDLGIPEQRLNGPEADHGIDRIVNHRVRGKWRLAGLGPGCGGCDGGRVKRYVGVHDRRHDAIDFVHLASNHSEESARSHRERPVGARICASASTTRGSGLGSTTDPRGAVVLRPRS